jgi:hypothetical protein
VSQLIRLLDSAPLYTPGDASNMCHAGSSLMRVLYIPDRRWEVLWVSWLVRYSSAPFQGRTLSHTYFWNNESSRSCNTQFITQCRLTSALTLFALSSSCVPILQPSWLLIDCQATLLSLSAMIFIPVNIARRTMSLRAGRQSRPY